MKHFLDSAYSRNLKAYSSELLFDAETSLPTARKKDAVRLINIPASGSPGRPLKIKNLLTSASESKPKPYSPVQALTFMLDAKQSKHSYQLMRQEAKDRLGGKKRMLSIVK